jgi:hypothetical protein
MVSSVPDGIPRARAANSTRADCLLPGRSDLARQSSQTVDPSTSGSCTFPAGRDCGACAAISMNTPSRSFRVKCTKIKKFKTSFEIRNDLLTQHDEIDIAKSIHPAT